MADASILAAKIVDRAGRERSLASVVGDRTCVLVFLRHFACPTCSRNAHAFAARAHEVAALGARLVLVGAGSPEAMAAFTERIGLSDAPLDVVCDDTLTTHQRAGMIRSRSGTYGLRAIGRSLALYAKGHYAKRRADDGDVEQQGGVMVVANTGEILLHRPSRFVGDDVDPNEVAAAILSATAKEVPFGT